MCTISDEEFKKKDPKGFFYTVIKTWTAYLAGKYQVDLLASNEDIDRIWEKLSDPIKKELHDHELGAWLMCPAYFTVNDTPRCRIKEHRIGVMEMNGILSDDSKIFYGECFKANCILIRIFYAVRD